MHFTGTIWRPPYEANSSLIQVTAGCTHNKCKFCSLYDGVSFRMSPLTEVEQDLAEISHYHKNTERIFLTGANPFVMSFQKLKTLALNIHKYLPNCKSIGCFSSIADIKSKTNEQLEELHTLGFDGITIGVETGDDSTLSFMNKGHTSSDILEQCKKLEKANITYNFFYLTGLGGIGKGQDNAIESANIFNQLNPLIIEVTSLTIFKETELYKEIQNGNYIESGELERLHELKSLISNLSINTTIFANTVSITTPMSGVLPKDKEKMVNHLQHAINNYDESELKAYRNSIKHL